MCRELWVLCALWETVDRTCLKIFQLWWIGRLLISRWVFVMSGINYSLDTLQLGRHRKHRDSLYSNIYSTQISSNSYIVIYTPDTPHRYLPTGSSSGVGQANAAGTFLKPLFRYSLSRLPLVRWSKSLLIVITESCQHWYLNIVLWRSKLYIVFSMLNLLMHSIDMNIIISHD